MSRESLFGKGGNYDAGLVHQKLGFDAMDSGRLLQGFDDVNEETLFDRIAIQPPLALGHEEVADDPLAAFIYEKGIANDASAIDGRVSWQDLGVHITQDHVGGAVVVPREQTRPEARLFVEQRAQIDRGEMS